MKKYVVFHLTNQRYAIDVDHVQSIESVLPITPLPLTRSFVKGVMNLRGVVIPVLDLKEYFHMEPGDITKDTRLIVVSIDDITAAFVVDATDNVIDIATDAIQPVSEFAGGNSSSHLCGVAQLEDSVIAILDVGPLLHDEKAVAMAQ